MDFYFTNNKIKKICYSIDHLESSNEIRLFIIELAVILSKMNKKIKDLLTPQEMEKIKIEIKKVSGLEEIFNKLKTIVSYDFISCNLKEISNEELLYYYFE
jgi:hypothetical protein